MRGGSDEELLVGVVALQERVEATLVATTPFGRLRFGGRRLVEDSDSLGAGSAGRTPGGDLAGETWLGCIANAVAKLTFGMPAQRVRIGVAVDGVLDEVGARPSGLFSTVDEPERRLAAALRGRDVELAAPPAFVERPLAVALGESSSALGALADGQPGLVLLWDRAVWWVTVPGGAVVRDARVEASELDYGFAALDRARGHAAGSERPTSPILTSARRGDARAAALLSEAARALAIAARRRLDELGPGARLVLAGDLGRATLDERLGAMLRVPFEDVLAPRQNAEEVRSIDAAAAPDGDRDTDPNGAASEAPPFHVSRENAAPAIGAAAWALGGAKAGGEV